MTSPVQEDVQQDAFDAVVMATGWPAAVEDLGLEAAGVEHERNRIPADEHHRTNVPHILTVGDAIGRDMLVQAAQFEGETTDADAVLGAQARRPAAAPRPSATTRSTEPSSTTAAAASSSWWSTAAARASSARTRWGRTPSRSSRR